MNPGGRAGELGYARADADGPAAGRAGAGPSCPHDADGERQAVAHWPASPWSVNPAAMSAGSSGPPHFGQSCPGSGTDGTSGTGLARGVPLVPACSASGRGSGSTCPQVGTPVTARLSSPMRTLVELTWYGLSSLARSARVEWLAVPVAPRRLIHAVQPGQDRLGGQRLRRRTAAAGRPAPGCRSLSVSSRAPLTNAVHASRASLGQSPPGQVGHHDQRLPHVGRPVGHALRQLRPRVADILGRDSGPCGETGAQRGAFGRGSSVPGSRGSARPGRGGASARRRPGP